MSTISTSITKSVIIKPGETFVLPVGSVITGYVTTGGATIDSTCPDTLPEASEYKCGYFQVEIDRDDNNGHSMDETTTYYEHIKVGTTIYSIHQLIHDVGDGNAFLNTFVPDQAIFSFTAIRDTDLSKRTVYFIYFQVPEPLYNSVELRVDNRGSIQYYRPFDATCGEYPAP